MPTSGPDPARQARALEALRRCEGQLGTAAMAGMEASKEWFSDLTAEDRAWVGTILQAGVKEFIRWFGGESASAGAASRDSAIAAQVFGAAPRALTGVITLAQTVELVRLSIEVVEQNLDGLLEADLAPLVHDALLRYGREMAFATAEVYARAAETRGAWDARLEALVVDSVLRAEGDAGVLSRASALGWGERGSVVVVLGSMAQGEAITVFDDVRRTARTAGMDALCAVQGDRMVVVLGGATDPGGAAASLVDHFGSGPVVHGPPADDLAQAWTSAAAALSAHRVAGAWPAAPVPVAADDLLPERILAGDAAARSQLVAQVYGPLAHGRGVLLETLEAWFDHGRSVEATARALFLHPNTIRYRLRQVGETTGLAPSEPRQAHTLAIALTCGRLEELTSQ
ncbi:helix-turn-helix domain-containing protein [Nocardioides sp. AE5]|uniref:PucR family transcriptional regulator n=1 Tax=Nocardioides sp. AE5 TaxID=2962573 RepID=UPI0028823670|nr:helix-turn-helix domain-containing protein [Nocardioides sp. AE5]MDT0203324.1 helix-turn-helix domain-containing protein [Nocardioides sp. AE5]